VNIRKIVTEELVRRKWPQSELCRKTGLLPHRVAEYLSGQRDIYVDTLQRILDALQLEIRSTTRRPTTKGVKTMFVVFEDLAGATETKVHKNSCSYYFGRNEDAKTTKWHGPFATFDDAEKTARSRSDGKTCGITLHPSCCWKD
jgi:transcriptional regulator with XRE-family HTH domain